MLLSEDNNKATRIRNNYKRDDWFNQDPLNSVYDYVPANKHYFVSEGSTPT
jgi:hypothetical protein